MGSTVFPWASFSTSAIARYTALNPQMMPSMPVRLLKVKFPNSVGLPVKSLIVNMKNRIAKLMNTNCNARFFFSVPKNIDSVNSPHMKK